MALCLEGVLYWWYCPTVKWCKKMSENMRREIYRISITLFEDHYDSICWALCNSS